MDFVNRPCHALTILPSQVDSLRAGQMVIFPRRSAYAVLVPLVAPLKEASKLRGILALGELRSGLTYSDEDQAILIGLANQVSMAMYVREILHTPSALPISL